MSGKRKGDAGCILTMSIKICFDVPSLSLFFLGIHDCSASEKWGADFKVFFYFFPYDYWTIFMEERLLLQNNNVTE